MGLPLSVAEEARFEPEARVATAIMLGSVAAIFLGRVCAPDCSAASGPPRSVLEARSAYWFVNSSSTASRT